ncbi:restriction endonuclease subunit S [Streptococcus alactolyticus]
MMSKKSPQLRFKGFTDDWEERKLGEIANMHARIGWQNLRTSEFLDSGEYMLITGTDFQDGKIDYSKVHYVEKERYEQDKKIQISNGSILITKDGTIGKVAYVENLPMKSTLNAGVFNLTVVDDINTSNLYLYHYLKGPFLLRFVNKESTGGTIKHLNQNVLVKFPIPLPSYREQLKISAFLTNIDKLITLHQRKLDLLKEQKKGFLQKMFPKNGEKVPELRFAGFADDWEERKLSSGLREYTDRVIVEDDKEYYQISVRNNFGGITLRGSKMGNKIGRKRQAKINLTKYPQTLIFTRQTVEQGGIGWVDKYCDGAIVTENMPTISLDTSVFSKYFLTNLFQTRIFYKNAILDNIEGGSAQIAIHESKFLSSTLLFPNLDEQEKIGQFFKQLDDTIALHQRKLDLLKEQKKGFLQKMFV